MSMLDLAIKGVPARFQTPAVKADAVTVVEPQMRRYRARVTRTVYQTATVEFSAMSDADRDSLAEQLAASVPDDAWAMNGDAWAYLDDVEDIGEATDAGAPDNGADMAAEQDMEMRSAGGAPQQKDWFSVLMAASGIATMIGVVDALVTYETGRGAVERTIDWLYDLYDRARYMLTEATTRVEEIDQQIAEAEAQERDAGNDPAEADWIAELYRQRDEAAAEQARMQEAVDTVSEAQSEVGSVSEDEFAARLGLDMPEDEA